MRVKTLSFLLLMILISAQAAFAEMEIYFAPNGGFAPSNRNRVIVTEDGRQLAPTLNNAVIDLIDATKDRGTIKIAMYAFSDRNIQEALIKAAFERQIKVKVILDGVAAWTKDIRREFVSKVARARAKAPKWYSKRFQIKIIYPSAFKDYARTRRLNTGNMIFGTMHEKFGVFYQPGSKIPFDCFSGSSNLSHGSDQLFAENRMVFKEDPVIARQFAEEFARLWNEYGTDVLGNTEPEHYIPASPTVGGVNVIFNSEPLTEESYYRIDEAIISALQRVRYKEGTIDIFMFSFTHFRIAQTILELAQRYPLIKIRILMDQTQLISDDEHKGILGPYLEERIAELGIKNIEIKYKWRTNVYFWDPKEDKAAAAVDKKVVSPAEEKAKEEEKEEAGAVLASTREDPTLDGVPTSPAREKAKAEENAAKQPDNPKSKVVAIHWRNKILHHKVLIVNRKLMVAGSYNWSPSAERRNLENVMIFNGHYPGHQKIIDRMLAEFDFLWAKDYRKGPFHKPVTDPQVIPGPEGRRLTKKIIETMSKPNTKPIMLFLDRQENGATFEQIKEAVDLDNSVIRARLQDLVQAGILYSRRRKGRQIYGLAD